jgi:hypothetical protein
MGREGMKKIQHHEIFPLGIPAILEVFEAEGSFPAVLTLEGGERLEMDLSRPSHAIGDLLDEIREFAEASLGKQG